MNCPVCSNPVTVGDPFCDNCGADLRVTPPVDPAAQAAPAQAATAQVVAAPVQAPVTAPPVAATPIATPPVATPPAATPAVVPVAVAPPPAPAPVAPAPAAPVQASQPVAPLIPPAVAMPVSAMPAPATPATGAPGVAAARGSGPRLVVKDTGAVCALPVGRTAIIGRTDPIDGIFPDVDLTPYDTLTGVSRKHAQVHEQGGQWFIQDLNSTNYTVVNRQRLQPNQDFLIEPGDEIRFGRLAMIFQL